jgi:hypothetical protein
MFTNNFGNLNFNLLDFFRLGNLNSAIDSKINYSTNDSNTLTDGLLLNSFSESSNSQRFTRFSNALINYDYKTGHYIGN